MARRRVAVLISGRGSNLQALIDAARAPDYPAEIAWVISNVADVYGLTRAEEARIATAVVDHKTFPDRASFEREITRRLHAAEIDLVCLAGFMRLLTPKFVETWHDRLINIHPSLLPKFPGLDTHARALEAGEKFAGCTVHFVRAEMDSGPMLVQYSVEILPNDDPDSLAARVLAAEHLAYPLALKLVASGRVEVKGETAYIDGQPGPLRKTINLAAGR